MTSSAIDFKIARLYVASLLYPKHSFVLYKVALQMYEVTFYFVSEHNQVCSRTVL